MLIITLGSEAVLYLSRYSYLFNALYEGIMVGSIFIGYKLHQRLMDETAVRPTKRQYILQFSKVYLIFYIGSLLINTFSTAVFQDFSDNYDQYVEESTTVATSSYKEDDSGETVGGASAIFEWFDTAGYDFYADLLAGLEEVYRLSYMIIFLFVFKKIFRRRWESGSRDIFLMLALFLSSLLFGAGHSLDTERDWRVVIGSVVSFTDMGLLLGILLLRTRNLLMLVMVHSFYDIMTTASWYYSHYTDMLCAAIIFIVFLVLRGRENRSQKMKLAAEGQTA